MNTIGCIIDPPAEPQPRSQLVDQGSKPDSLDQTFNMQVECWHGANLHAIAKSGMFIRQNQIYERYFFQNVEENTDICNSLKEAR